MRAVRIVSAPDGMYPEVRQVEDPEPAAGTVLVRVEATALNRSELIAIERGRVSGPSPAGRDFAGTVAAAGDGVSGWRVGDRVMGQGTGVHAELVVCPAGALMRVPSQLSWAEAAAFPNVFVTAHDALVTNAMMAPGEIVVVNAASSGIGTAAIQIASALGAAAVVGVSRSSGKLARLGSLGMTAGVDAQGNLAEAIRKAAGGQGADVVIDSVGGASVPDYLRAMALHGRLVTVGRLGGTQAQVDLDLVALNQLRLIGVTFRTRTEAERLACIAACARDLLPHLAAGRIRPAVDRVFAMSDIRDAYAYMARNEHTGKIVLTPRS